MQSLGRPPCRTTSSTSRVPAPLKAKCHLQSPSIASRRPLHSRRQARIQASADQGEAYTDKADLEAKLEEFLRQQAEMESGVQLAAPPPPATPDKVIGAQELSEEEAKKLCRDVVGMVKTLKTKRDMAVNEIKLTISIEDPRTRERRESLGIEDGSGVSRDEMAIAFMEVVEGRIPRDRLALRELHKEMNSWPYLSQEDELVAEGASASYEAITDTGVEDSKKVARGSAGWRETRGNKKLGRDESEKAQGITDMLPDWMGYGVLYLISAVPVLIGVSVVAILFFNSLR
ncbi:hypothetical protein WJX72_003086 [[Myrmecia] bisecta]|uniref:Ycf3-interacting protein 1, chloroplastic n=1 Tax=[Myrmecia] bisecta TaxID=41462 RepID=A0AAW1Q8G4_9CHLO